MDETTTEPARPSSQLRVIAAVLVVLVALLLAWYFFVLRQDYATLYSDLRPHDAAQVVEVLEKQGVPYRLAAQGSQVLVPAAQLDAARLDLASSGAPAGGAEGFELFNDSDMGLTDFAQKIRYQRALQGELARTIMRMEGVADARVHISMPERTLFRGERRNAEAAVTLVMHSPQDETPARIEGVQRLVAAAVPDLQVSDVVVLNARGELISPRVEISNALERAALGAPGDPHAPSIDFVMTIMRQTLPDRRFEVTIERAPESLAGGDDGEATQPQRVVTVLTETPLSDAEMESVSAALRSSGVVDGQSGGTLVFRRGPPFVFEALSDASAGERAEATAADPQAGQWPLSWLIGAAGLVIVLAGLGVWGWLGRTRLAPGEHDRFADQLKAALRAQQAETHNA